MLSKACEDPVFMLQQWFGKSTGDASTLLTLATVIGAIRLSNGNPLIRYVINLDIFNECGRYAEPGNGSTTLRIIAENRGSVKMFLPSAELWVLGFYAHYLFLEAVKRAVQEASG